MWKKCDHVTEQGTDVPGAMQYKYNKQHTGRAAYRHTCKVASRCAACGCSTLTATGVTPSKVPRYTRAVDPPPIRSWICAGGSKVKAREAWAEPALPSHPGRRRGERNLVVKRLRWCRMRIEFHWCCGESCGSVCVSFATQHQPFHLQASLQLFTGQQLRHERDVLANVSHMALGRRN